MDKIALAPWHRVYACFFLFALALGALLSRIPNLQTQLGVSESQLGLTLIGLSIGALISLTFASPLIDRLGSRTTAMITVLGTASIFAIIPWLPSAPLVFAGFFCAGLLAGALEINLNVETDRLEAQYNKRFMNRAHGSWSAGFFCTALLGASFRQWGVSITAHLAIVVAVVLLLGVWMISGMVNAPRRATTHSDKAPLVAFPNRGLLPLCLIGIAAFLVEGAGVDWSAIYMRDVFDVAPFVGGLSLTLFSFFMAIARLSADPVVERFGPRAVAMSLLGLSALGALLVGLAPAGMPAVALVGFALLGIGCSAVYPIAVSAAAQRTDRPSAINVAALGQVTFIVFFLAPPLLGLVAEHAGIRNSYLIVLPVIVVGLFASRVLGTRAMATPPGLPPQPATPLG